MASSMASHLKFTMKVDSNFQNAELVDQFNDYTGIEMINGYQTLVFAGYAEEEEYQDELRR